MIQPSTADWPDLVAELDRWEGQGRVAAFWWRDDDAVAATPELECLLRLAGDVPVGLAVIPALARAGLAEALRGATSVTILQHGWCHKNHAMRGKKNEYPEDRALAAVAAEISAGRTRLTELFGPRALAVFVPPWNRMAPILLPALPDAGITGLSTMASQRPALLPPGLAALDVHVDVTDWTGNRGFAGTGPVLDRLIGRLQARRLGAEPATAPIGILTHHLTMDCATTAFLDYLVALLGRHPAARWTNIVELLP